MKLMAALCLTLLVLVNSFPWELFQTRRTLSRLWNGGKTKKTMNYENTIIKRLVWLGGYLKKIVRIPISEKRSDKVRNDLAYAGYANTLASEDFFYMKLSIVFISITFFGILYLANRDGLILFNMAACSVLSYFVPDQWLSSKVKKRNWDIRKNVPYVLSLFSILTEAGLNITQALEEISKNPTNELIKEIKKTNDEIRLGVSHVQAFENLATRANVEEINHFVSAIIQGLEKGNSGISAIIKDHARTSWETRKSMAKELAEKASIKLFLPLLFLVLPAMVIFLLGPMIFSMIDMLNQGV